jgi:tetratricopeptide (TPR) repeat protein
VAKILEVSELQVRTWLRAGPVSPQRDPSGHLELTFQDLLLLRTTKGLLESGVSARHVRRIWSSLRRQLSDDLPLTSLTIYADGHRVVAWDGNARWQPDSGQFLLNFDSGEIAARAAAHPPAELPLRLVENPRPAGKAALAPRIQPSLTVAATSTSVLDRPADGEPLSAEHWFHLALELETSSPAEARQAYHQAIALEPAWVDAHVNLGRLYHEARELGKAEAHYREAVRHAPEDPTAHFNLGVLLEDRGRREESILAYRQAIVRDPELADAHYNLGLLLESLGRRSQAMSHLMTARNLYDRAGGDS